MHSSRRRHVYNKEACWWAALEAVISCGIKANPYKVLMMVGERFGCTGPSFLMQSTDIVMVATFGSLARQNMAIEYTVHSAIVKDSHIQIKLWVIRATALLSNFINSLRPSDAYTCMCR